MNFYWNNKMRFVAGMLAFTLCILFVNVSFGQQVKIIATGSGNAYTISYPGHFTLNAGQEFTFQANHTITGTATLNVNGSGVRTIMKNGSSNLASGDIIANQMVHVVYDGTNFQLLSPVANGAASTSWLLNGNSGTTAANFLGTTDATDLVFRTNNTEKLRLTSGGFLGLGTASPTTLVHLEHSAPRMTMKSTQSTTSANAYVQFGRDDGAGGFLETGSVGLPGGGDYLGLSSPQFISFNTNFSQRMVITNSGNVGINSGNPFNKLTVNGEASIGNSYQNITAPSNGLLVEGRVGLNATTPASRLTVSGEVSIGQTYQNTTAPANGMIVEGKVGIGTTSLGNEILQVTKPGNIVGAGYTTILAIRPGFVNAANGGTDWSPNGVDAGVKGVSYWGNNYSAGIAGYNYVGDFDYAAGVIGGDYSGGTFGALAYRGLTSSEIYAGYFNGRVKTTSDLDFAGALKINGNPGTVGQVLTSNGAGTPTWSTAASYTATNGVNLSGSSFRLGGNLIQNTDVNMNTFNMTFTGSGNVGIKIATPAAAALHVHEISGNPNVRITSAGTGATSSDGFAITNQGASTVYLMQNENADMIFTTNSASNLTLKPTGFVGVMSSTVSNTLTVGGNASVGTGFIGNSAPTNGMIIQGNVGVGTNNPGAAVLYQAQNIGTNKKVLGVAAITNLYTDKSPAILELKGSSGAAGDEIGVIDFINRSASEQDYNFARIAAKWQGTNPTYSALSFSTRNGSTLTERMLIDELGTVNISGTINLTGGSASEIRRSNTGAANLIPIAYGCISAAGAINSGTGNFTVVKTGTGMYDITITGFSYGWLSYATSLTMAGSQGFIVGNSVSGALRVNTYNVSNVATDNTFYFIVYRP